MRTKFGVDSSSRFPFGARTQTDPHTQTRTRTRKVTNITDHPTHAIGNATAAWNNEYAALRPSVCPTHAGAVKN